MIKLTCEDNFLKKNFTNLIIQKRLITPINNLGHFSSMHIKEFSHSLELIIDDLTLNFKLPLNSNLFLKKFMKNFLINISLNNCSYFPYQRLIKAKDQKKTYLSYLQNIILSNLIINKDGIEKFTIYKLIWPEDRNISMNKLDTHLTNLKNHINTNLNIKIYFQSHNKVLRLIIN